MSTKHFYSDPLVYYEEIEEEEQEVCPSGYIKRQGKPARRERDCSYDCETGEHCNEQESKAFWKGQKWKPHSR